jgi:hypothetical protein
MALINSDQRIPICYIMWLNENPFWSDLQYDRQATTSFRPEQLHEEESSTTAEIFLNVKEEGVEE